MKFKIATLSIMATMALASCTNNETTEAPVTETVEKTKKVESVLYTADASATEVNWKGEVAGVYGHEGYVNLESGTLTVEGDQIVGGTIVVDMTGIYPTDSASYRDQDGGRITDLQNHLSTPDFFATATYPTSTFEITGVENGAIKGNLTIRDKTNEETLEITNMNMENGQLQMSGTLTFDRQNYDVAWVHFMKDMVLSDDIVINFNFMAKK